MRLVGSRPWLLPGGALATCALGWLLLFQACRALPPRDIDDLCEIFAARPDWAVASQSAHERWGLSEPIQLAILHQESRFRREARPDWKLLLGVIPVGRLSSAYGFGQVKTGTWQDYQDRTGRSDARRDRFSDVVDFVGWYGDLIHRVTGVAKHDAFHLYIAYHEGPSGFTRGDWREKPWLIGVARKVESRARVYQSQQADCSPPRA